MIGNKIKQFRKEKGLTQKELAAKLGVAEITIRKYESGDREPKLDQLEKIASALDIEFLDLMDIRQQNLFYLNEAQIYLNKVLSSENHPATPLVGVLLSIITHISQVAPVNSTELEKEDIEYLASIRGVFSQLHDSLLLVGDTLEDYKVLMKSIERFIFENYKEYFFKHYQSTQDTTTD